MRFRLLRASVLNRPSHCSGLIAKRAQLTYAVVQVRLLRASDLDYTCFQTVHNMKTLPLAANLKVGTPAEVPGVWITDTLGYEDAAEAILRHLRGPGPKELRCKRA